MARLPIKRGCWLSVVGKLPPAYGINISSGAIVVSAFSIERQVQWHKVLISPRFLLKFRRISKLRSRKRAMNCIISIGVAKALCAAGEMQSTPTGTPRRAAISGVILVLALMVSRRWLGA